MGEVYEKIQSLANELLRHTHAFPLSFSSLTYGFLRASIKNDGIFRTAVAKIRQVYFCFYQQKFAPKKVETNYVACYFPMSLEPRHLPVCSSITAHGSFSGYKMDVQAISITPNSKYQERRRNKEGCSSLF